MNKTYLLYNSSMKAKKTIQEIKPYPVPLFEEEGYLKLDSNESDFGPSPKVIEALRSVVSSDIQYYPYYGKLLQKLADFHKVEIDNIILTVGADEAISAIFGTFLEYGNTVLTVTPSFVMPKIYAKLNGLNYKEIPYSENWIFPENEFAQNITDEINLVHLTTPNSPTGEIIDSSVIENIVQNAGEKAVLIDETYGNYSGVSSLDLVKTHDNVFVVRSFSKDFALAGLRLGYVISDSRNIKHIRKYLSPYNVSTITVKAGIAALDDVKYFEKVRFDMEKSKQVLADGLEKLGAKVYPSKTNFLCVDFGKKADFVYRKLLASKIKVKYFNHAPSGPNLLENTMRIAVPRMENTLKVLETLKIKPTIAFDMDGVLVDASKSYRVAVQETFKQFSGQEVTAEEISATKKLGGLNNDWDLTEFLLKKQGIEIPKDDIVEAFQRYYEKLAEIEEILVDKNFLENLSKNYNLAIFTGRLKKEAFFTLERNGVAEYFSPIITLEDVGLERQKPDCLGLKLVKEKIITDKIYYLGDTVDDMVCVMESNQQGGVPVTGIGVLPPQDKSDELKSLLKSKNAMVVLEQTKDLETFLTKNKGN